MSNGMAVTVIEACVGVVAFTILVAWIDIANQKRARRRAIVARIKRHLDPINPEWIDPAVFERNGGHRRPLGAAKPAA